MAQTDFITWRILFSIFVPKLSKSAKPILKKILVCIWSTFVLIFVPKKIQISKIGPKNADFSPFLTKNELNGQNYNSKTQTVP